MPRKTYRILVRLPEEMEGKLKKLALKKEMFVNDLIVQFVHDGLEKPEPKRKYEKRNQ